MTPPKTQLPATIHRAEIPCHLRAPNVVPTLTADLGEEAGWRYVEFFTANIRLAYARACSQFFAWREQRGLTLGAIRPHDVATYIEQLLNEASAPPVRQQPAAVGMLFGLLVTGQVVPTNPA